ncbi:MAG: VCBS repeat-containing protein, partial [Verrucomicrobiota bacterium]
SVVRQAKANFIYEIDEAGAVEIRNSKSEIRNPKVQVQNAEVRTSSDSEIANRQLPVTSYQLPVTSYQLPITSYQLPVTNSNTQSFFQDASAMLQHVHHEEAFDDFARQPLLPKLLSQLGPGVAWADCDLDGHDDLIIGCGKNGTLAFYRNEGNGQFSRPALPVLNQPLADDSAGLVAMVSGAGRVSLLVGLSNYEGPATNSPSVVQCTFTGQTAALAENLPATSWASGPLALADIDGDEDLDLFVGGRVWPGKYPEAASSLLYRNAGGRFQLDAENSPSFQNVGMVSGAVFSDLNGDGYPDLALACEWGPIRVFLNERGRFKEATEKLGLNQFKGWWNGVSTGDFDGDGRLDIVGSNWGRNSRYESHRAQPLRMYYGDLDGDGTTDIVEAYFDLAVGKVVPERALGPMSKGIPKVRQLFSSHRAYAEASVEDIFGESLKSAKLREANWLESTLFLNRGNHFEARVLPVQAQVAPAFGISVGDLDGDGNEDLFLSQNFFATQPETCRYDGGRGLWLQGDGRGGFQAVPGQVSGVKVYGEQRGCALADYDEDGRVDLAVTQNGAATKLFHNVGAKLGLRVRVKGPAANPLGVGAQMRLLFGTNSGPVREIHAGSGYWSQDSAVQVMGLAEAATAVWVRWPGGKTTTVDIPPGVREVIIDQNGTVQKVR